MIPVYCPACDMPARSEGCQHHTVERGCPFPHPTEPFPLRRPYEELHAENERLYHAGLTLAAENQRLQAKLDEALRELNMYRDALGLRPV